MHFIWTNRHGNMYKRPDDTGPCCMCDGSDEPRMRENMKGKKWDKRSLIGMLTSTIMSSIHVSD